MSWGPWVEHDGKGCPLTVGQVFGVQVRWVHFLFNGREKQFQDVVTEAVIRSPSWRWESPIAEVLRYRIRKPKGLTMLEDIAKLEPVDA